MSASPPSPASSEEAGEGEEEREEFYESLDRILSSSCSSTSASDDEADHHRRGHHHHHHHHPLPRFPPASAASLDVWLSEPATVEERRRRLLQQMGLSRDPTLARRRPGDCRSPRRPNGGHNDAGDLRRPGEGEIGRSVSSDGLSPRPRPYSAVVIGRSRSEGSVDPSTVNKQQQQRPAVGLPTPNKPPLVGGSRPPSAGILELLDGEDAAKGDGRGCVDEDRRCTIRNLDNGKEFVVKEFREDGMWNQLREVGTGRQLTMEEFELCVGHSPIVQELMRRQNVADSGNGSKRDGGVPGDQPRSGATEGVRSKKRGSWLKSIKNVAGTVVGGRHNRDMRSSDERDTSSEKGGRRSSSATDDSQEGPHDGPQRIKVRQYGKAHKELSFLYMSQEIQAHSGSIWSIKFSFDGRYLASAGEDCVIHVWQVSEHERKGELLMDRGTEENGNRNPFVNGSPEPALALACFEGNHLEKKRRAKVTGGRKSVTSDQLMVPEHVFALSDKPVCTFWGHLADVLDLSWSKSQYLLSSSMDKTVRLWHMSSNSCLRTFSHSDYVTCIQFNPVDDRYFISGSLDEKVRIWSIPDRQVVDWNDLHEMVTAACYTPDGQGALVGSHKGSCHLYNTADNKLHQRSQIDLQNKKKKSSSKKITGFQFAPGSSSEVLITSADSRIRVIDGVELVHKFKGFRNTSSQISASLTPNGNYVICASEDSHVYVWRHDTDSRPGRSKGAVPATQSFEHFHCQNVTVAVSWPGTSSKQNQLDGVSHPLPPVLSDANWHGRNTDCQEHRVVLSTDAGHCSDRVSATWPEENLLITAGKRSPQSNGDICSWGTPMQSRSAWGMVIVTAGRGGEIITFQNFGIPVRL